MSANWPKPTDDDLLKFFVDDTPSMAMTDYLRRHGLHTPYIDYHDLAQRFEDEYMTRMYGRKR